MKTFAEEFIPMISSREKVWTVFLLCVLGFRVCGVLVVSVSTGVSAFPARLGSGAIRAGKAAFFTA